MDTGKFPKGRLLALSPPLVNEHPGFSAGGATRLPLPPGGPPKHPGMCEQ